MIVTGHGPLSTRRYRFHELFSMALRSDSFKARKHFQAEYGALRDDASEPPDLEVTVSDFDLHTNGNLSRFGRYSVWEDWIYANDSYKVARWKFALRGLGAQTTQLFFQGGPFSLDFLQHYLVEQIMRYKVSERGSTLVHGSCVAKDGLSVLCPGLGHTGKTALALRKVLEGWQFQADDYVFVSSVGETLSYPRRLHISDHMHDACPDGMRNLSGRHRLSIKTKKLIYYLSLKYGDLSEALQITELIPQAQVAARARLGAVVLLIGTDGTEVKEPRPIETDELIDRIAAINSREGLPFVKVMLAHQPSEGLMSLHEWWGLERENLRQALSGVPAVMLAVPQYPEDPAATQEAMARVVDDMVR